MVLQANANMSRHKESPEVFGLFKQLYDASILLLELNYKVLQLLFFLNYSLTFELQSFSKQRVATKQTPITQNHYCYQKPHDLKDYHHCRSAVCCLKESLGFQCLDLWRIIPMGLSEPILAPIHQSIPTTSQVGHENLQTLLTAEQEQFVPFSSWLQELE